ncbi:MAG: polyprenyl diphosphate synthase [Patescibacteria group bacterium]|nr:polyprenyl diphosphate synthase [Patescibacteria group bacterium]
MNEAAIPKHIGFILDGNRRWAVENGLPKLVGHKRGYENLKTIADECFSRGISIVSTYIFSTENWNRELEEVNYLMDLALKLFKKDLNELMDKDIRVVVSGSREKLSEKIIEAIDSTVSKTANNKKGTINICFNYGGQSEIADAVAKIIESKADASQITTELIRNNLYQPELPPVDYIIRTSGEKRLSNFLLWDSAYAELEFVATHWPAFSSQDLDLALVEYANRKRRFGK